MRKEGLASTSSEAGTASDPGVPSKNTLDH